MALLRGKQREVHAGAAAADNADALGRLRLREANGIHILKAGAPIDGTLGVAAFHEFIDAAFLTADAGADFVDPARIGLAAPVGIRQQGTAQHDHIAHIIPQSPFCHIGIAELTHGNNRNLNADI